MVFLGSDHKVANNTKTITTQDYKRTTLKRMQRDFLDEITANSPLINDLGVAGCQQCDIRVRKLQAAAFTINEGLVAKQIKFIPPMDKETNGVFEFDRIFYESYQHLASFKKESFRSAESTSNKLAKYPKARSDLNWKLSSDFLNGRVIWMTDYALTHRE